MLHFRYYCRKKALHISATPLRFLIVYVVFLKLFRKIFSEIYPSRKRNMRHLIKNGCFRTDRTIEWVCHNDPGCFQLFFHGFLATDGCISLAQKSLCDLQRTEQLNLFSCLLYTSFSEPSDLKLLSICFHGNSTVFHGVFHLTSGRFKPLYGFR